MYFSHNPDLRLNNKLLTFVFFVVASVTPISFNISNPYGNYPYLIIGQPHSCFLHFCQHLHMNMIQIVLPCRLAFLLNSANCLNNRRCAINVHRGCLREFHTGMTF